MNARTLTLGVVGAIVVAGAAALFVRQRQVEGELRAQNQALRQQLGQSSQLGAENERLSEVVQQTAASQRRPEAQLSELLKLRSEVGRLRQQAKEAEALRESNRLANAALATAQEAAPANPAAEPASADFWPQDSWRLVGYATPDAALQSQFYAASQGDLKTFMAYSTGEILEHLKKELETKSEAEVNETLTKETKSLDSVRILKRETLPDGTVSCRVSFQEENGTQEASLVLQKVGNDWKIAKTQ